MSALRRRIRLIWDKKDGAHDRYVARALNPGVDGSWQVYDRRDRRFISDQELRLIPEDRLTNEQLDEEPSP